MNIALFLMLIGYSAIGTIATAYLVYDWIKINFEYTKYRNGYTVVKKAFEDLKDRLKKEAAVQIPPDSYYVFCNFNKQELALMLSGIMSILENSKGLNWNTEDYQQCIAMADKIKVVMKKTNASDGVRSEDLKDMLDRGILVALLHKEPHARVANKDYLPYTETATQL